MNLKTTSLFIFIFLFGLGENANAFQKGTIRGTIVDATTHEPLAGANVKIVGSNPLIGAAADKNGNFVLTNIALGRHNIKITFIGYQPVLKQGVLITSGKETVLTIEMQQQSFEGEGIVVTPKIQKDQPLNDMAYVSARSFSVEETRRYAGGLDDPARMATAFAGVTSSGGIQNNALAIRGNAPKSTKWHLEGVEIPNPNHFSGLSVMGGGGLTLFSSQLLSDSDFMTGAFPAQYGNSLSGIFDIHFRSGNPIKREHTAQLGINGIEVASEGPFSKNNSSATYLFNYRYSTLALIMPLLPTEGGIKYQDLSFKVDFHPKGAGHISVWGIGGLDAQKMDANRDSTEWEYDFWDREKSNMHLGIGAAGISHSIIAGHNSTLESALALTSNYTSWDQQRLDDNVMLQPNININSTTGSIIAKTMLSHRFSSKHKNRTGINIRHLFYNLDVQVAPNDQPPLVPYANGKGSSNLIQGFTESQYQLSPSLNFEAGLRIQWFTLNNEVSLEPRAGIQWHITNSSSLSLGYGLQSQLEDLRIYLIQPGAGYPNKSLKMNKAHHFVAGYNLKLNNNMRLKLEAYDQELYDIPVVADSSFSMLNFVQDWTFNEPLVNKGKGRNYGLEATLERFLDNGYYYLFTGTVYKSRYKGGNGLWHNTRFDQGFVLNLLGGKELMWDNGKKVLGINGRVSYIGGERHSPIDYAASRTAEEVKFNTVQAFKDKFPDKLILDLTFTYRINHSSYSSVWALQIKNVLLEKDYSYDYNFKTKKVDLIKEGTPLPLISYKIEF